MIMFFVAVFSMILTGVCLLGMFYIQEEYIEKRFSADLEIFWSMATICVLLFSPYIFINVLSKILV
jgi:hypothetical protein